MPCCISIMSLCEHNNQLNLYVFNDGLNRKTLDSLYKVGIEYGVKVQFIEAPTFCLDRFPVNQQFPKSIYYRLLLPELFPNEDKLLYLDSDTIVNDSLESLWKTNIDGFACGCVMDFASGNIVVRNRVGLNTCDIYFNSGVLLINLKYWKENNLKELLFDYLGKQNATCLYPDQDALNAVLKGKVKYLDLRYNVQSGFFYEYSKILFERKYWESCLSACHNPVIIHFTTPDKPWFSGCLHPLSSVFLKYYKKSIFRNRKLLKRRNSKIEILFVFKLIVRLFVPAKLSYRQ